MKTRVIFLILAIFIGISSVKADYPKPAESLNGKYGYVSPTGQFMIRPRYDNALPFNQGYAAVEIRGKWGFIDVHGRTVAKCEYESVKDFNLGYAIVKKNGKWGAIDPKGELVVPCQYDTWGELDHIKVVTMPDGTKQYTL